MTATTPSDSKAVSLVWLVSGSWGPDFSEDTTGLADFGVTGGVGGVGIVRGFSRMKLLLNSIFKGRITAATSRLSFSPTVLVTVTWTFLKRSLRTNWNWSAFRSCITPVLVNSLLNWIVALAGVANLLLKIPTVFWVGNLGNQFNLVIDSFSNKLNSDIGF